jgi:hypothetical protein
MTLALTVTDVTCTPHYSLAEDPTRAFYFHQQPKEQATSEPAAVTDPFVVFLRWAWNVKGVRRWGRDHAKQVLYVPVWQV